MLIIAWLHWLRLVGIHVIPEFEELLLAAEVDADKADTDGRPQPYPSCTSTVSSGATNRLAWMSIYSPLALAMAGRPSLAQLMLMSIDAPAFRIPPLARPPSMVRRQPGGR